MRDSQQIFASKYQRVLPTEAELVAEIEREKRLIGVRHDKPLPPEDQDSEAP